MLLSVCSSRCHIERLRIADDVIIECETEGDPVPNCYEARVMEIFTHLGMEMSLHMHYTYYD